MKINKDILLILIAILILALTGFMYYKEKYSNSVTNDIAFRNFIYDSEGEYAIAGSDGTYIGIIKNVSSKEGNYFLTIDYIKWTSPCTGNCTNGYEIFNFNPMLRTFPIFNGVAINMETYSQKTSGPEAGSFNSGETISLVQFEGVINDGYMYKGNDNRGYNGDIIKFGVPFWITLKNGVVTEISEQYLP